MLKHPVHAHELIALLRGSPQPAFQNAADIIEAVIPTIHAERTKLANQPIATPVGELVPGSVVTLIFDKRLTSRATLRNATVGLNRGSGLLVNLNRNGTQFQVRGNEIHEIRVQSPAPRTPIEAQDEVFRA